MRFFDAQYFSDDFEDASLDTTNWNAIPNGAGATITQASGRLALFAPASTYPTAATVTDRSLRDKRFAVSLTPPPGALTGFDVGCEIEAEWSATADRYDLNITNNTLSFRRQFGGETVVRSAAYDAVAHKWLGLRASGGNVLAEVSADGVTWTTFGVSTGEIFDTTRAGWACRIVQGNNGGTSQTTYAEKASLLASGLGSNRLLLLLGVG